jgi:hypothetical protein
MRDNHHNHGGLKFSAQDQEKQDNNISAISTAVEE